ncbi:hypothetical protein ACIQ1H_04885 [Lysinibacillus sp. NPDC097279]|uniref:hypothetical protein n=1 Tax=Lysinibacillus sp. NPDC097279 TaxID=3364143 RepID=UPI0037FAE422
MKKLAMLFLISGLIVTLFGFTPFLFYYPFSDSPNSGPSNLWELILMISYEGKVWYLIFGIVLLSASLITKRKTHV